MTRLSIGELDARCQKPNHHRMGHWYARLVARPLALRVTWLLQTLPISAHQITVTAWLIAAIGCALLAYGTVWGWVVGAAALQLWYLLDHVDGQVARLRGTASLDGVQLDYLMHHTVTLLLPIALGASVATQTGRLWLLAAGVVWAWGLMMLALADDTRCKAFEQRLKRLEGELIVEGRGPATINGTARPSDEPASTVLTQVARFVRVTGEMPIVINVVAVLAICALALPSWSSWHAGAYLLASAVASATLAIAGMARSVARGSVERSFASWYHPPQAHTLDQEHGNYRLRRLDRAESGQTAHSPRLP